MNHAGALEVSPPTLKQPSTPARIEPVIIGTMVKRANHCTRLEFGRCHLGPSILNDCLWFCRSYRENCHFEIQ